MRPFANFQSPLILTDYACLRFDKSPFCVENGKNDTLIKRFISL